jgi:hypothetical protein
LISLDQQRSIIIPGFCGISSPGMIRLAYPGGEVVPLAPHMACLCLLPGPGKPDEKPGVEAYVHDCVEILGFDRSDPYTPQELNEIDKTG